MSTYTYKNYSTLERSKDLYEGDKGKLRGIVKLLGDQVQQ